MWQERESYPRGGSTQTGLKPRGFSKGEETQVERTPGPWFMHRTDWRGDPVEHKIYISGDEHEDYGDDDDDEIESVCLVASAVAIVEGNATSHGVTEANARLIAAAPTMYQYILDRSTQGDDLASKIIEDIG